MAKSHFPTVNWPSTRFLESAGGIVFSRRGQGEGRGEGRGEGTTQNRGQGHEQEKGQGRGQQRQICIVYHTARRQYLLPKGRRDHGESRRACALREVREEAGLATLAPLPLPLRTRATPPATHTLDSDGDAATNADPNIPDQVRTYASSTDAFMCTVRDVSRNDKDNSNNEDDDGDKNNSDHDDDNKDNRDHNHDHDHDDEESGKQVKFIWWFVMQADAAAEGDGATGEPGWERRWVGFDEALALLDYRDDREIVRRAIGLVRAADGEADDNEDEAKDRERGKDEEAKRNN